MTDQQTLPFPPPVEDCHTRQARRWRKLMEWRFEQIAAGQDIDDVENEDDDE